MWIDTAKDALRQGRALELRYDGYSRFVEVHALGYNRDGHALMRCWQVSGGGVKSERVGWKLMRLDRGFDAYVSTDPSLGPRLGYKRGDRNMHRIIVEL
jgi:YD repeat-containing protein